MVRKMNSASALLIDILENAISILNNARKKNCARMNPHSFFRDNGNSLAHDLLCFYFDKGVGVRGRHDGLSYAPRATKYIVETTNISRTTSPLAE